MAAKIIWLRMGSLIFLLITVTHDDIWSCLNMTTCRVHMMVVISPTNFMSLWLHMITNAVIWLHMGSLIFLKLVMVYGNIWYINLYGASRRNTRRNYMRPYVALQARRRGTGCNIRPYIILQARCKERSHMRPNVALQAGRTSHTRS